METPRLTRRWPLLIAACLLLLAGGPAAARPLAVAVTVPPLAFLAGEICGPACQVVTVVGAGQEPHHYQPPVSQVHRLAQVDLYCTIGLEVEATLVPRLRAIRQQLKVVDIGAGLRQQFHGDPHLWLAPEVAGRLAANMARAIRQLAPASAGAVDQGLARLQDRLAQAHEMLQHRLAPVRGTTFFCYHGGYQVFAETYGLQSATVAPEGRMVSPRRLAELVALAQSQPRPPLLLAAPQFARQHAEALAQRLGARLVVVDPLAGDIFTTYQRLAGILGP